tara:strand:- start:5381 stop:7282 length:1902 start_codon:yes stop_codon:yes gene_type:complete
VIFPYLLKIIFFQCVSYWHIGCSETQASYYLWELPMTPSQIDNPFTVIGSDTMDANKVGKKPAFNGNSGLFAQLMHTTGVQQVAYAGTNEEFDLTLEMQDETVAHEAKMGEDHQKYDGLGLFSGDAASIETSRKSKKLDESQPKQSSEKALNTVLSNGKDQNASEQLLDLNATKLTAVANPTEESGVDATRAANAAEALRAAKAQVLQPNNGAKRAGEDHGTKAQRSTSAQDLADISRQLSAGDNNPVVLQTINHQVSHANNVAKQAADNAAEVRGANNAPAMHSTNDAKQSNMDPALHQVKPKLLAEEMSKFRHSTPNSRPTDGSTNGNQQNSGIQLIKVQEEVVSQPANTLAASAVLAVQTAKPNKPSIETPVNLADDLDTEARPPLSNVKATNSQLPPQQAQQAVPQSPNVGLVPTPQTTPQNNVPKTSVQQTQILKAAGPDSGGQPAQTGTDSLAGGQTNNSQQSSQRAQRTEAPQTPRPQVAPQELTKQVAVEIKKAIGQGADQIRIQLKPAELGRVEVKLEVTADGRAMAVVSVERPETLDLLQRDAAGLRQALQDAGLNTDSNSLSFNLRSEGNKFEQQLAEQGHFSKQDGEGTANKNDDDEFDRTSAEFIAAETAAADGRVNIQV